VPAVAVAVAVPAEVYSSRNLRSLRMQRSPASKEEVSPPQLGFAQYLWQLRDIRRNPPRLNKLPLIWSDGRRWSNGGPGVVRLLIGNVFGRRLISIIEFFLPFSLF
jgi:hypothetical protein